LFIHFDLHGEQKANDEIFTFTYCNYTWCSTLLCRIFIYLENEVRLFQIEFPIISRYYEQLCKLHLLLCICRNKPMVETIKQNFNNFDKYQSNLPFFSTKPFVNDFVPNIIHRQGINKVNGSSHHLHLYWLVSIIL